MKRIVIAAVALVLINFGAQAQYFAGGQFGFSTSGGSEKTGNVTVDKPKTTYFNFSPKAGMFLSEKFAAGMSLNVMSQRVKTNAGGNTTTDKTTSFGIAPFARYYFLQMNKFGIFAEGQIGLAFSKSERPSIAPDEEIKATTFGLNIAPVIYYNLSEKFTLEASIRLFNFGINTTTEKDQDNNKEVTNSFRFGASLDGLVNTGDIYIGAIYKF